jgi:hypothetical protein
MTSYRPFGISLGLLARRDALRLPFGFWLATRGEAAGDESDKPELGPVDSAARALSPARRSISLNGLWKLTFGPLPEGEPPEVTQPAKDWPTIPATVPGNVELDLVAAGHLEEPQKGNRIYELRRLEDYQWWYRRSFSTPNVRLASISTRNNSVTGMAC